MSLVLGVCKELCRAAPGLCVFPVGGCGGCEFKLRVMNHNHGMPCVRRDPQGSVRPTPAPVQAP